MAKIITVRSTEIHDRVVLYELHPDHPKGKGWVTGNGKPVKVAHTAQVNRLIGSRLLEIVNPPVPAKVEPPKETNQQEAAPAVAPKTPAKKPAKADE